MEKYNNVPPGALGDFVTKGECLNFDLTHPVDMIC